MRGAWKLRLCATLLWVSVAFPLYAQSVLFRVEEAENGEPLSGVVIRAVGVGGQTVHYTLTDREGLAEIPLTQSTDTLKVSLLGFRERFFLRPFRDRYHIQMETAPLQISPAGVTAHKVEEVGDTIRYNVKALKDQEDLVLSDFLKRLPGVDVSKSGYVKYNGRDINRFYVDGKDILESNYNLATRHLAVDAVQSVEVLKNHQPIQMLRGIKESDRAAMNIVLDEKARSKVTGSASAAVGVATAPPTVPLSGKLTAFYVAPSFSSVDVAGYDGQGNA